MYLSNSDISTEQYKLKQRIGDIARTIEDEELMRRKTKEYLAKLSVRIATEYYFHNIQIDQINRDKYFFFYGISKKGLSEALKKKKTQ